MFTGWIDETGVPGLIVVQNWSDSGRTGASFSEQSDR
jgi:hypothetical protein